MTVVCSSGVLFGGGAAYGALAGLSVAFTYRAASDASASFGSQLY